MDLQPVSRSPHLRTVRRASSYPNAAKWWKSEVEHYVNQNVCSSLVTKWFSHRWARWRLQNSKVAQLLYWSKKKRFQASTISTTSNLWLTANKCTCCNVVTERFCEFRFKTRRYLTEPTYRIDVVWWMCAYDSQSNININQCYERWWIPELDFIFVLIRLSVLCTYEK